MSVNLWLVLSVLFLVHWTKPIDGQMGLQRRLIQNPHPNDFHQNKIQYRDEHTKPYYPRPQEPPPYYHPPRPHKNSLSDMQDQLVEKFSAMFGRGDHGGGGYGGGGYGGGCCGGLFDWRTSLPAYALLLVTFFLLYLLNSAVTSSSGRKLNSAASGDPGDEGTVYEELKLFH